jgi:hypothetical protein
MRERPRIGINLFSINARRGKFNQELREMVRILGTFPEPNLFIKEPETDQWNTEDLVVRVGEFQQ